MAQQHMRVESAAELLLRAQRRVTPTAAPSSEASALAQQWVALDKDPQNQAAVLALAEKDDVATLRELLGPKRLAFGTAGLRGRMGPGFQAMNAVTVQQTTQGLCSYMLEVAQPLALGVVIGFDGRHNSARFARTAAAVFVSKGIPVHMFAGMVPTPWVAAGVAELQAAAGIMITGSHNPKDDNGYKVYWGRAAHANSCCSHNYYGCQIIPPQDEGIAAAILRNLELWPGVSEEALGSSHPLVCDPTQRVEQAYFRRLEENCLFVGRRNGNADAQPVTYTPLHGVGAAPVLRAFEIFGLPPPHIVPQQAEPDPDFPTVVFPNPEEGQGTWALAFEEASARGSRLVIANDPDADRLAVAEREQGGGYRPLTGNEIGALLAWWLWKLHRRISGMMDFSNVMLASTVSSKFIAAMAAAEGFAFEETLTGFKWLGNRSLDIEHEGKLVLFAYEEALGFMMYGMYKDKDGVAAAAMFCEMAASLYAQGSSCAQQLAELYSRYGFAAYRSGYFIAPDPARNVAVFERLRSGGQYAQSVAGVAVESVRDLGTGVDTGQPDGRARLPWRAGDLMITYTLEGSASLTLRASGTEPKLKYYLEVVLADATAANELAARLVAAVEEELVRPEQSGLQRPSHA